jgi:hypothetical protein
MTRRIVYSVALLTALSLVAPLGASAGGEVKPWIEVRSPHFRVLTDGTDKDGRRVALDFENLRYVFATSFPGYRLESGAPLLIFAPSDENSVKLLDPAIKHFKNGDNLAGLFSHGWEKQYAWIRLDTLDTMGEAPVFHEYTHSIVHMNVHWLPLWLDEGIAEYYAYTEFQGKKIKIGVPTERYRTIATGFPIPIETLLTVDQRSPYYHDLDKEQMFYGESWALVHYLQFGPGMDGGAKLNDFFRLLHTGVDQKKAFLQTFGDFKTMDDALDQYMRLYAFKVGVMPAPAEIDEKNFTSRELSVARTEAELAGYRLWNHDALDARPLVAQALADDPSLGLAHEENAFLLYDDGKTAEAADEFAKAYTLDPNLYLSLFAKTMLSPIATSTVSADEQAFRMALVTTVQLNPQFAPAYVQLSRLALRAGNLNEALRLSLKAEDLEPWRAGYHLQTGQILLRLGRYSEAAGIAQYVAPRWFGPDHNEAVELWNDIPVAQRPAGDPLSEFVPQDSQQAEGIVKSVDCGNPQDPKNPAHPMIVVLDLGGQALTFHQKQGQGFEGGFSDTLWYGEDHFEYCHNLERQRGIIFYRPPSDSSYAGDIAGFEVRNDLPSSPAGTAPATTPAPATAPSSTQPMPPAPASAPPADPATVH